MSYAGGGDTIEIGGSAWESNPPGGVLARHTGFEDQGPHQIAVHFRDMVFNFIRLADFVNRFPRQGSP